MAEIQVELLPEGVVETWPSSKMPVWLPWLMPSRSPSLEGLQVDFLLFSGLPTTGLHTLRKSQGTNLTGGLQPARWQQDGKCAIKAGAARRHKEDPICLSYSTLQSYNWGGLFKCQRLRITLHKEIEQTRVNTCMTVRCTLHTKTCHCLFFLNENA